MTRRHSLRLRITAWYAALLIGGGAILLGSAYLIVRHNVAASPAAVQTALEAELARAPTPASDEATELPPPSGQAAGDGRRVEETAGAAPGGSSQLVDAQAEANSRALRRTLAALAVAFAGLILVALLGGWLAAGRALRPLREVTAAARSISGQHLRQRVASQGPPDELKELADAFDAMVERLERTFDGQRRFAANVAHELRTPLAVAATEIDVVTDGDADPAELQQMALRVRHRIDGLDCLIGRLLSLAEADNGIEAGGAVDLAEVVREALLSARATAGDAGIEVEVDLRSALVSGDRFLLASLAENLVENAIRHNRAGGRVRAVVYATATEAVFCLANGGPVLDPATVDDLYRPFVTSGRRSGHSGLGLSIVRSVAAAHGGEIEARPLAEGGLAVTVRLPLLRADTVTAGVTGGEIALDTAIPRTGGSVHGGHPFAVDERNG